MRTDEHLILHGLAIKRHSTPEDVSALIGIYPDDVRSCFEANVATGRVVDLGRSYALSPGARLMVNGEYSRHYAGARSNESFLSAYEHFERVNSDLKSLITAWQVRPLPSGESVVNDHSDADYDEKVIDKLSNLHERFTPTMERLSAAINRLERYGEKLDSALDKAEKGDTRWISEVEIPSYHTVWFELHEDLLCILGKARVEHDGS